MLTEERLAAVAAQFEGAALGNTSWQSAVETFAGTLGLGHGQLVAFGRESLVTLNVATSDALDELESFGGHAPDVNSRVRVGSRVPELTFLDERDFTTEDDAAANPQYGDWLRRHNVGYSCVTPLIRRDGVLIGLAALRKRSNDAMTDTDKRGFMAIAARARSAVNLALALEDRRSATLAFALGASATAALVCDASGRLTAVGGKAEDFLSAGRFGRLLDGMFVPHRMEQRAPFARALAAAIEASRSPLALPPRPVALSATDGERAIAEFVPLPRDSGFAFTAAATVIIRAGHTEPHRAAVIAQELFELTAAEARVAGRLLDGRSPQDIAAETGTSVGTVRNHVHRVLSKAHCKSQVEFLALMRRYA